MIVDSPATFLLVLSIVWVWSNVYVGSWDATQWSFGLSTCLEKRQWYRVFTAPFVHRMHFHLALNVFVLWAAVSRVEKVYGSWFLIRYSIALMCLDAFLNWALVKFTSLLIRDRERNNRIIHSYYSREACTSFWNFVKDLNARYAKNVFSRLVTKMRRHFSYSRNQNQNQNRIQVSSSTDELSGVVQSTPLLQQSEDGLMNEDEESVQATAAATEALHLYHQQNRQQHLSMLTHPFSLGHVMGCNGLIVAWLVFSIVQVEVSSTPRTVFGMHDLYPVASAATLPMTNVILAAAEKTTPSLNPLYASKIALARTGYSILGLFELDPNLAPLLYILLMWFIAPGRSHQQDQQVDPYSWRRMTASFYSSVTSIQNARYALQSLTGFSLGLFLGLGWLSFLPNVYWTLCFMFNCFLISLTFSMVNKALGQQQQQPQQQHRNDDDGYGVDAGVHAHIESSHEDDGLASVFGGSSERIDDYKPILPVIQWAQYLGVQSDQNFDDLYDIEDGQQPQHAEVSE